MSEKPPRRLPPAKPAKEGELMSNSPDNGHLINQYIVQMLVEKDSPEEIKDLMKAELDFNRERLAIVREHAALHPEAIEDRATKGFRRVQYSFLMGLTLVLLPLIFFSPISTALTLCAILTIVVSAIAVNGRDRDNDSDTLISLLDKIIRSTK